MHNHNLANESKQWYAHSENDNNKWHLLSDHIKGTQNIAEVFGASFDFVPLIFLTALLHDLGKYQKGFQRYLEKLHKTKVPHSKYGAVVANGISNIASMCIAGHHGGLHNKSDWKTMITPVSNDIDTENSSKEIEYCRELLDFFLKDNSLSIKDLLRYTFNLDDRPVLEQEVITRFIFSCLVDADWLDTESHFREKRYTTRPNLNLKIEDFFTKINSKVTQLSADKSKINNIRNDLKNYALSKAGLPVGFYSLNLPTGMGKTFTSFLWALKHAEKNELRRIIIVLPFVNIIDQTAKKLKEILGEDQVLEHHSGLFYKENEEENEYNPQKLACENWDYPVIITTTVQFFESLFSNRTSSNRRIHNIAESVVIFDEIQTLKHDLVVPTLRMLMDFSKVLRVSFLFCTATLPAFGKTDSFDGIPHIISLVKNPEFLFSQMKRVEYHLINELEIIELEELCIITEEAMGSVLIVFNMKDDAKDFFNIVKNGNRDCYYHLSTNMCPTHRKEVISKIDQDLSNGKNICVVSTQLIEAGVDLDFNNVYRAIAPMESIIQSAGRCNRNGKIQNHGNVYIFRPVNDRFPEKHYRVSAQHTASLIKKNLEELHSSSIFNKYYEQIMRLYVKHQDINTEREAFNFKNVSRMYKLIQSPTQTVFINEFNVNSRALYERIKNNFKLTKNEYREIQLYSVQLYENAIKANQGFIEHLPSGLFVWMGDYSEEYGVILDRADKDHLI